MSQTPITEIDVIYGDDDPFYGFDRVNGGKVTDAKEKRWESVDLAVKRGSYSESLSNPHILKLMAV